MCFALRSAAAAALALAVFFGIAGAAAADGPGGLDVAGDALRAVPAVPAPGPGRAEVARPRAESSAKDGGAEAAAAPDGGRAGRDPTTSESRPGPVEVLPIEAAAMAPLAGIVGPAPLPLEREGLSGGRAVAPLAVLEPALAATPIAPIAPVLDRAGRELPEAMDTGPAVVETGGALPALETTLRQDPLPQLGPSLPPAPPSAGPAGPTATAGPVSPLAPSPAPVADEGPMAPAGTGLVVAPRDPGGAAITREAGPQWHLQAPRPAPLPVEEPPLEKMPRQVEPATLLPPLSLEAPAIASLAVLPALLLGRFWRLVRASLTIPSSVTAAIVVPPG